MVKTSKEIKKKLTKQWKSLEQMWLTDSKYFILTDNELKDIVNECSVKNHKYISDAWDCDNFALQLHAMVQQYQYDLISNIVCPDKQYSWAFGEIIGIFNDLFKGKYIHAINIAITNSGVNLIEPQTNRIFKPTNEDVFFVKF